MEAARLRRHHPSPRRRHGSRHDRPGHGQEVRRAGLPHGGLEPHGQGADQHRDIPRQGRLREVPGAHRHPGRCAAAHARHARHPRCGGLRPAAQGRLLHQHGARRPCRRRGAAGGARFRPSCRRRARRLQPGAAGRRPSLLDASQGPGDAAHRRRHQPAHRLARDHREHQAPAQRARADQTGWIRRRGISWGHATPVARHLMLFWTARILRAHET